jgi:hypothetical protein
VEVNRTWRSACSFILHHTVNGILSPTSLVSRYLHLTLAGSHRRRCIMNPSSLMLYRCPDYLPKLVEAGRNKGQSLVTILRFLSIKPTGLYAPSPADPNDFIRSPLADAQSTRSRVWAATPKSTLRDYTHSRSCAKHVLFDSSGLTLESTWSPRSTGW